MEYLVLRPYRSVCLSLEVRPLKVGSMRRRSAAGPPPPKLLCVDDDRAARQFYQRILEGHGYRVLLADSGARALQLLKKNLVRVVLSDFEMPGMNGGELAAAIKRQQPRMPVVLLSGRSAVVDNPPKGVDAALPKGASLDRLIELIETLGQKPRAGRSMQHLLPLGEALAGVALAAFVLPRILK